MNRADGKFGYTNLPLYWTEENRHAFLIHVDRKLAGLAMVKRGSDLSNHSGVWDLAEFFIVRGYRRRGIGTVAAHALWSRFPGSWEVRVMKANPSAYRFWQHAISVFADDRQSVVEIQNGGRAWHVLSFYSGPQS